MPCASDAFVAASLPVVGLPVPEQQVSEPVPRWQREHVLLQFHHGPPPLESGDLAFHCKIDEELDPPYPASRLPHSHTNLAPLPCAVFKREINNAHAGPSHGIAKWARGRGGEKKEEAQLLLFCVNADLLCPRAAATGRLHPSACGEAPLLVL